MPWLLGIAAHHHAWMLRHSEREARAFRRFAGRALLDRDDYQRLEDQIDAARLAPEVRRAIDALPPGERDVVELTGYEGLTPAEAAAALHIRPATARMRLNRGRKKLRRAMGDDASSMPVADTGGPPLFARVKRSSP